MYLASMEQESSAKENALFSNIESSRSVKPAGYPEDNIASETNSSVAKLNGTNPDKKIGPSLVIKVMAGDTIRIGARAFYKSQGPVNNKKLQPAEDMVTALAQAFGNGGSNNPGAHASRSTNNTPFTSDFYNNQYQHLKEKDQQQNLSGRPKAYLDFVLFNEQFKMVEENSEVKQVKAEPDQLQTLAQDKMVVKESGFLYIYTSNESPQDVFFDNVILDHITGPVLEETHYYPFGLTMSGISSKAVGKLNNRIKFNGYEQQSREFEDGSGLEWYDYKNRFYDNQIGRFFCVDRLASDYTHYTPYQFAGNEVPNAIDLDGLEPHRFNLKTQAEYPAGDNLRTRVTPGDHLGGTGAARGIAARPDGPVTAILRGIIEPPLTALNTLVTGRTASGREATLGDKVEASATLIFSMPTEGGGPKGPGPMIKGRAPLGEMPSGSLSEMLKTFPDNATVVRGGINTPELIRTGTGTHPEGYTGISVECGACTVKELSGGLKNNQIGVTTVGDVRAAGGNVIKTSGLSPNHGTLIGLTPEATSTLFNPPIRNPNKPVKQ
jgi:RHS repeat-associated protein